MKSRDIS